jgi:50S ribosomal protein L16 3-hydroxylase
MRSHKKTDSVRQFLGGRSADEFLREYWQRQAMVVRNAVAFRADLPDGDDLAGLACEPGIDARIIQCGPDQDEWFCQQGPFDEGDFANLPARDWTLLVQAVDQHDDAVRALLEQVDFLPRWRLDDIMVSYAAPGGGVGPHFDYYDVFLLQVRGERQWKLGQHCDQATVLRDQTDLRLLEHFEPHCEYLLKPGDLLYLPPGIAHWGTAVSDECMTFSIGVRAPSQAEVLRETVDVLCASLSNDHRYTDAVHGLEKDPYLLGSTVAKQLKTLCSNLTPALLETAALRAFGRLVTEGRGSFDAVLDEHDEDIGQDRHNVTVSNETVVTPAAGSAAVQLAPLVRCAYAAITQDAQEAALFVAGEEHTVSLEFARAICNRTPVDPAQLGSQEARVLAVLWDNGQIETVSDWVCT